MPLVAEEKTARGSWSSGLLSRCANPQCATSWMRLWRSRHIPAFEGRWACSSECMTALVQAAVRRESAEGAEAPFRYTHRIPLGLMLVQQGQITQEQLRSALETQKSAAGAAGERVRLGQLLLQSGAVSEEVLARALAAQWGGPVVGLERFSAAATASAMPQFLAEALGVVPGRVAAGRILYLAFSCAIDRALGYAVERITGLQAVAGMARDSEFPVAQQAFLTARGPRTRFLEAASTGVLVRALTKLIESEKPVEARLARVHGWYWLRLWRHTPHPGLPECHEVEDMLCTVGPIREAEFKPAETRHTGR